MIDKKIIMNKHVFYHTTEVKNRKSIEEKGLIPQIGRFSKICNEQINAIWMFNDENGLDNALCNWFGEVWEEYAEDELGIDSENLELSTFKITLPNDFPGLYHPKGEEFFESHCVTTIPPEFISYFRED